MAHGKQMALSSSHTLGGPFVLILPGNTVHIGQVHRKLPGTCFHM
jgi:hypothetical protein